MGHSAQALVWGLFSLVPLACGSDSSGAAASGSGGLGGQGISDDAGVGGASTGGAIGAGGGGGGGGSAGTGGAFGASGVACEYAGSACAGTLVAEYSEGYASQTQADDRNLVYRIGSSVYRVDLTDPGAQPERIRTAPEDIHAVALLGDQVIYLTPSTLRAGPLAGGSFGTDRVLATPTGGWDLAVLGDAVYYSELEPTPGLFSVPLSGGAARTIASVGAQQLEVAGQRLYLTDPDSRVIAIDPASSGGPILVYDGGDAQTATSLDGTDYIATPSGVIRLTVAGQPEVLVATDASALLPEASGLFINERTGGRVLLLPRGGGAAVPVARYVNGASEGVSLATNSTTVFWSGSYGGQFFVQRAPKCGCP